MYNYVDHRWFKTILKKALSVLLIYSIFFTTSVNAGAEKWEIVENVYDTSKNVVNVTAKKVTQQASNSGVYKVQVPVSASSLGKTVKAMMWTGVAVAAVQALIGGVGWIIDTGSKTIKRPKPGEEPSSDGFQYRSYYADPRDGWFNSMQLAGKDHVRLFNLQDEMFTATYISVANKGGVPTVTVKRCYKSDKAVCLGNENNTLDKRPVPENLPPPEYEIMTDAQLGEELTGRGEVGRAEPDVVAKAYDPNNPLADEPAPKATNDALNNANPEPEKEPEGKSETEKEKDENGEETGKETTKFELPKFCEWAPAVCDFFTVQKQDNKEIKENQKEDIAQNKSFFDKVSDWFDWSKENDDLDNDNDPPEIKQIDIGALDTSTFKGTPGCPAPIPVPVDFGSKGSIEVSYEPICQLASKWSFVAPLIGFISGAMIIIGVGRKGEDGEI